MQSSFESRDGAMPEDGEGGKRRSGKKRSRSLTGRPRVESAEKLPV
jgi:hypothetical protein